MFGRRKFNDFSDFDDLFRQLSEMFGNSTNLSKENGSDELGDWTKETFKSEDGTIYVTNFIRNGGNPKKSNNLDLLKMKLDRAIENENFEEAVKLRDQIKNFESNNEQIQKLDSELKTAIKEQNFEKAIELRDQIKKLKS
jgi:hypothetical protein